MDYVEGALQRTISQVFQQQSVCTQSAISPPKIQQPYAYVAYERDDRPDSTGAVLFYADTVDELASRAHVGRASIYRMLVPGATTERERRLPFVVKKIYLV